MTGTTIHFLRTEVGGTGCAQAQGVCRVASVPRRRGGGRIWVWRTLELSTVVTIATFALQAQTHMNASDRAERCRIHLARLGHAMYDYHEAHGHFPPAALAAKDGRPLLSWRVAILPYLGLQDLYDEFRLDEPWDSTHNRSLLSKMPEVYVCPSEPTRANGLTFYKVVVGPAGPPDVPKPLFERGRSVEMREVTDGTSNTLMVAEAERPVPWTMPGDLEFEPGGPIPSFAKRHPGGFNVVFADGSAKLLKFSLAPEILRGVLTRDGGEVLGGG